MKLIFYRIVQQGWNFSEPVCSLFFSELIHQESIYEKSVWSFFSVNLFIKKAFMKSRDHFGTPMPLCMSVTQLKVSSTHLASTVGYPKMWVQTQIFIIWLNLNLNTFNLKCKNLFLMNLK